MCIFRQIHHQINIHHNLPDKRKFKFLLNFEKLSLMNLKLLLNLFLMFLHLITINNFLNQVKFTHYFYHLIKLKSIQFQYQNKTQLDLILM